jgi:hypothetical protein
MDGLTKRERRTVNEMEKTIQNADRRLAAGYESGFTEGLRIQLTGRIVGKEAQTH